MVTVTSVDVRQRRPEFMSRRGGSSAQLEFKVTSKDAEECVDPAISQSIVVRREVVSVRN